MSIKNIWNYIQDRFKPDEELAFEQRLQKSIEEACSKTKELCDQKWMKKFESREKELIREYTFKLAEKDEVIKQQSIEIGDLHIQLDNAQTAYQNYVHEAITIKRIIAEVSHQMERVFDKSGELFQGFSRIKDTIEAQTNKLEKDDDQNRNLLGMSQKSNKILLSRKK